VLKSSAFRDFHQPEFDQNLKKNHQISYFLLAICSQKASVKVKGAKIKFF
jgi:hypothetical protein